MAVQTTEEFKNGGATSYAITIEYLKTSDIKVRIDGALQDYVASGPSTGEYTVSGTTVTLGATAAAGTGNVHIYRETDVNTPAAVFAVGSAIKASELNAIHDMGRFAAVEHRNKIISADIKEGQVTSTEIKDGSILNADINASAAIDNTKIADGLLKSGITVNSANIVDGSIVDADVSNSAAISGSKLADDSIAMTKLLGGALPGDITVSTTNIEANTIVDSDINASAAISHSKLNLDIVNSDINSGANIAGSKLANDSVDLTKLGGGPLPTDITVAASNIVDGTIGNIEINNAAAIEFSKLETGALPSNITVNDSNIITGTLDNRYYTETELDAGQLDNRYFTETELNNGQLDTRYYTEAELNGGQLNNLYFTESEITGGAADGRYYTETELDAGQLDNRYYTETELNAGQLDNRYYTETEAEALFLRQDSSETIASGVSWSAADDKVATTAAIDLRIIELVDDVGGFVPIANETSFPTANPDINTSGSAKGGTIVSVIAASTNLTAQSGTTLTIANGRGTGNAVIITGVSATIPQGFGFLVETTATDHTYAFHRLVPKATEVSTVAANAVNIAAAGANVTNIDSFADRYQISTSAPTARADSSSLVAGDLWFDSSSNKVMMVYDASSGDGFSPITPNQSDLTNINIVAGQITFVEDLGLITNAVNTGSGNNSVNTVATNISNVNTAATNIAKITTVADDLNEGTSEIDTVATSIANVNTVGSDIANVNTVAGSISNVNTVQGSIANVNTTAGSIANVNTVATNITDVNTFANRYRIDSSNPSTSLDVGDLYFNTSQNELRIYNGSTWQGGVTATGNLVLKSGSQMTGNLTFSGSQTVDGRDVSVDGTKLDGIEAGATADQTASEVAGLISGQTIAPNVITTTNLTLDFGSIA